MVLQELQARGLLADVTDRDDLAAALADGPVTFYLGIDPTADSLHLGSLVPLMMARCLQKHGHKPILVVGGATGMIGDPSGKSAERNLLDEQQIAANVEGMSRQLQRLLSFEGDNAATITNNADWFAPLSFIGFLRDVGKHLTVNYMMAKDSVKQRLSEREQGISYTEFSYMCLQAYDFVHLSREKDCTLQIGGSDQWGNITAGIELSRKLGGPRLFGLTCPLLLDSSGQKMGKTATGERVWLDPEKTSPYAFYQYLRNQADAEAELLLRRFSQRDTGEIEAVIKTHQQDPRQWHAQKSLAEELTSLLHGKELTERVIKASQVIFGGDVEDLSDADLAPLLVDVPNTQLPAATLDAGIGLIDLLVQCEMAPSKGAARRLIRGGGVYLSNRKCADEAHVVSRADLSTESMLLLRTGRQKYHVVTVA